MKSVKTTPRCAKYTEHATTGGATKRNASVKTPVTTTATAVHKKNRSKAVVMPTPRFERSRLTTNTTLPAIRDNAEKFPSHFTQ